MEHARKQGKNLHLYGLWHLSLSSAYTPLIVAAVCSMHAIKLLYLAAPPVLLANKDRLTLRSTYTKLLCADLVSKYPSACTKHYYISSVFITCKTSVHDYADCNTCAMLHDSTPDSRIVQLNAICKLDLGSALTAALSVSKATTNTHSSHDQTMP